MLRHARDVAQVAAVVYFTQGALGITGVALPLYLRNLRWSVAEITTVSSLVAFPWILKILYGLISDSLPLLGYRRKSYLILCSLISCAGWAALVFLPSHKLWVIVALSMANLGFAATDVITDGLIVEHSRGVTSHIYQSIAWGARSLGAIFGGVTGGWLAAHWAARDIFSLAAFLPLFVMIVAFRIHEKKLERGLFRTVLEPFKRCVGILMIHNIRWFIVLLILMTVSSSFAVPFFFYMRETLGFHETFLGFLLSLGWLGAIVGSVLYGRWLSKISPKILLRAAILINSLNILSTVLIQSQTSAFILVFIGGLMSCLTLLPIMSVSAMLTHHSGVEGSMFAILMSLFNLGQIFFGFLGGRFYDWIGLYPMILGSAAIGLLALLPIQQISLARLPAHSSNPQAESR